jgi:hypothetical protein
MVQIISHANFLAYCDRETMMNSGLWEAFCPGTKPRKVQ